MLTEPGGPFIDVSKLNLTKYAQRPPLAKVRERREGGRDRWTKEGREGGREGGSDRWMKEGREGGREEV